MRGTKIEKIKRKITVLKSSLKLYFIILLSNFPFIGSMK